MVTWRYQLNGGVDAAKHAACGDKHRSPPATPSPVQPSTFTKKEKHV
jgi:hypothetical protein